MLVLNIFAKCRVPRQILHYICVQKTTEYTTLQQKNKANVSLF